MAACCGGDAAGGHTHFFRPGADLHAGERGFGRGHTLLRRFHARLGHVAPGGGVVARLLRAGFAFEQQLVTLEVGVGSFEFGEGGRHVGLRGFHLRFGLTHVLRTGGHAHQAQLRFRRRLFRLRSRDREREVRRVEREDAGAGFHLVAFLHVERQHAAAHLGRQAHLGGFHVSGDAELVGVGRRRAGGDAREHGSGRERFQRGHRAESLASMLRAVCCMWAMRSLRGMAANIGRCARPGSAAARSRTAFIIIGPRMVT